MNTKNTVYGKITGIPKNLCTRILFKNHNVDIRSSKIVLPNKKRVNLNAWIDPGNTEQNVGDKISQVVVDKMCEMKGIDKNKEVKRTRHLYAVGSILLGYQDCTVWGSGFLYEGMDGIHLSVRKAIHKYWHKTDIRAVRGPETKRVLDKIGIQCPEIYGDPAILLPLFYHPKIEKKRPYVIIPQYYRANKYVGRTDVLFTVTDNWQKFIDTILESELVISASLHGVILAEAYGIPALLLNDIPLKDLMKYKDWYYSTGRKELPLVDSVEEALGSSPPMVDSSVIERLRQGLIDSFPVDLWQ